MIQPEHMLGRRVASMRKPAKTILTQKYVREGIYLYVSVI